MAPWLGIEPGSSCYKTNALTTEAKHQLSDADVDENEYILEAIGNL